MLKAVFRALDAWVAEQNVAAGANGELLLHACTIRVFGQMALWELRVNLTLAVTQDVDVLADYEWSVRAEFERLLRLKGKFLDPLSHGAWMPPETEYRSIYAGRYVSGLVAESDFVLLSKALKAPEKNRALLLEYLADKPTERFLRLAKKYRVDLERFV